MKNSKQYQAEYHKKMMLNPEYVARRRAQSKKWKEKNKERIDTYVKSRVELTKEYSKHHYDANKDRKLTLAKKWREENADRMKELNKKYRETHKEHIKERHAKYHLANPEKAIFRKFVRRAKIAQVGGKLSYGIRKKLFHLQSGKCVICKCNLKDVIQHLDHTLPLHLGGMNVDSNMQLLCSTCNLKKGAKHPVDFMQQNGLLL